MRMFRLRAIRPVFRCVLTAGALAWLLVACASPAAEEAEARPTPTPLTAAFKQATSVIDVEAAHEVQAQATKTAAETANVASGQQIYGKLCAQCHGENLAGTDQGGALTGYALTRAELERLLRTGGGLGNDHLFGTARVSGTGIDALHAFITASAQP